MEIGYAFGDKAGDLSLEVRNLFDNQFNWVTDSLVFQGRVPAREILFTLTLNL